MLAGDVLLEQQQAGQGIQQSQAYAYDRKHQLVAAQTSAGGLDIKSNQAKAWRYHYGQYGNRDLRRPMCPLMKWGTPLKPLTILPMIPY